MVYKREGNDPKQAWNELLRRINELVEQCDGVEPLELVTENHIFKRKDILDARDKLIELCPDNSFGELPAILKDSTIQELINAIEAGQCCCEDNEQNAITQIMGVSNLGIEIVEWCDFFFYNMSQDPISGPGYTQWQLVQIIGGSDTVKVSGAMVPDVEGEEKVSRIILPDDYQPFWSYVDLGNEPIDVDETGGIYRLRFRIEGHGASSPEFTVDYLATTGSPPTYISSTGLTWGMPVVDHPYSPICYRLGDDNYFDYGQFVYRFLC